MFFIYMENVYTAVVISCGFSSIGEIEILRNKLRYKWSTKVH